MRKHTALNRECAPPYRAHSTPLGAHAAEGEGEGEGDIIPHDDPESFAARVQTHPPTDSRAKPRTSGPRRGHPEEPVGHQHRIVHGAQRSTKARASLRHADCSAAIDPVRASSRCLPIHVDSVHTSVTRIHYQ